MALISLLDPSKVVDKAGNYLSIQTLEAPLKKFIYVSEGEKKSIEAGGTQIHVLVMLLLALQLAMRMLLNTTMQHIWEVAH